MRTPTLTKKMRRASGPDKLKSKPQRSLWSQEGSRRSTSPHPVELPFTLDTLTEEIKEISKNNAQSSDLLEKKQNLRSVLESVVRLNFPGCSLHLVGSSVNGFGNKSSDADYCLMLTHWGEVCVHLQLSINS
ncbi:hypothetical protein QZH41_008700 [Actinostola sp. cb2023]|nr:hypothetical protein QZH41_008700 [Actinostola sp. cb2023]